MGTIVEKGDYLANTKSLLKEKINDLGGNIDNTTTFREYAEELDNIYTNIPKTTDTGTNLSLNTIKGRMNSTLKGDTSQAILPSAYQQVEYIESTGSAYIDTGIIPNTNTKIDIQFETIQRGNFGIIFGGEETYKDNSFHLYNSSGVFDIGFGSIATAFRTSIDYNPNVKYTLIMDKNGFNINGNTGTFPEPTISTTYSIYLFAVHRETNVIETNAQKRIYYCKLYNNGTLVRDMIPCYRISDNVIGMYDIVGNTFYTNAGSGTFTKGSNAPTPDTPIDIEVVTGTQEVKVENVNLLNYNTFVKGRINSTTGQIEYASNTTNITATENTISFTTTQAWNSGIVSEFIKVGQGSYTYSIKSASLKANVYIDLYDKDQNFISRLGNKVINANEQTTWQVTISNTSAKYIRLHYEMGYADTITLTETQLQFGSVATPYTPHQEQTQTVSLGDIELCKIGNYQDYLYKSGDKWYKKEQIGKVVLNGASSEGWEDRPNYTYADRFVFNCAGNTNNAGFSNYFIYKVFTSETFPYFYNNTGQIGINYTAKGTTTLAQFKTWLSTHNVEVYYVLATPNDIEITNTTLINQLNNLEKMYSYNGITNISTSGNLPIVLGVSALKGE